MNGDYLFHLCHSEATHTLTLVEVLLETIFISSASCNVRKKKDFLVNGMQNTAHNAALLQLLQRLVSGQDNEMTACGVKGGARFNSHHSCGPAGDLSTLFSSHTSTRLPAVSIWYSDQWVSKHHNPNQTIPYVALVFAE